MLYIHRLQDFNPKSVDIESTSVIRELKRNPIAYTEQEMDKIFSRFFMTEKERELVVSTLSLLEPALKEINDMALKKDPVYEAVNFVRSKKQVSEVFPALANSLKYHDDIKQSDVVKETSVILMAIPTLVTTEEKISFNSRLEAVFGKILMNSEFCFNFFDIINEAHVEHINDLKESLENGFLFHRTIEEEIKKLPFEKLRQRIPKEHLQASDRLLQTVLQIKKGIDSMHEMNLRMAELGVILYSYVKMVSSR